MGDEDPEILIRLNDGRTVPTFPCNCGSCKNEFFVPGYSEEWMPSFCPFCGMKFLRRTVGSGAEEEKADFRPTAKPTPATKLVVEALRKWVAGRHGALDLRGGGTVWAYQIEAFLREQEDA